MLILPNRCGNVSDEDRAIKDRDFKHNNNIGKDILTLRGKLVVGFSENNSKNAFSHLTSIQALVD